MRLLYGEIYNMATLREKIDYAKQNPESEYAKRLYFFIQQGDADQDAANEGIDLSPIKAPQVAQPVKEPSFAERIMADKEERVSRLKESKAREEKGEQGKIETGVQLAGEAAGGIFDIASQLPGIKQGLELAGKGIMALAETRPIKEGAKITQPLFDIAYDKYQSLEPKDKETVDALGNLVAILPAEKVIGATIKAAKPAVSGAIEAGKGIVERAVTSVENKVLGAGEKIAKLPTAIKQKVTGVVPKTGEAKI